MKAAALLFVALVCAAGCVKDDQVVAEPTRLRVITRPPQASVYVDGHYFGRSRVLAEEPKTLAPGFHLMTVYADDHFPHDMELDLPPGVTTITIELRPIPP